ncbi:MAG: hypothetical protein WD071_06875 [Pseudohongiella sp.]|uniref:hypothetical protein n=1 Tax=Pseudohongiella sp. TaxID=1979412 RepID=UPI0034A03106
MPKDWKDISDDELLNFDGAQTNLISRYERIMQKKMIENVNNLNLKITGLMETIYRASQGLKDRFDASAKAQKKQQNIIIALTIVIAISTALYTFITWQSVSAMRESNDIQRQLLELEIARQESAIDT